MKRLTLVLSVLMAVGCFVSAAHAQQAAKKWTILVYVNADNNLNDAGLDDVNEMEMVGSTDQVNIVAMLDLAGSDGTTTYFIQKDAQDNVITSPVVRDEPEQDMGDYNTLVNFVKFGAQQYPAERYLVSVWNHGAGWQKGPRPALMKGISYDDQSGNHINTPQMGVAFAQIAAVLGHKVDIVGCDACLMQMAEVAYEVKDSVDVFVASEETEPGDGWPYDKFLAPLAANPAMSAKELATIMVDEYDASYAGGSQGESAGTQSALDMAQFGAFGAKLDAFAGAMLDAAHLTGTYKAAIEETQAFYYSQCKDLGHFLKLLLPKVDGDLKAKAQDLLDFLPQVIIRNATNGDNMANATGLSIYMPTKAQLDESLVSYRELAFAALRWDEVLVSLHYPNVPVLSVQAVDVDEPTDGTANPGDALNLVVRLKNDGLKPGLNLTVTVTTTSEHAQVLGGPVTVAEVPGTATVEAPAIAAKIADTCPIDTVVPFAVKVVDGEGKVITDTLELKIKGVFAITADVLLLVKDREDPIAKFYAQALQDANVKFDQFDTTYFGAATLGLLSRYLNGVVIVPCPDTADAEGLDLGVLAAYLDKGGSLFVSGQDIGYSLNEKPFYAQYLHATFVQDSTDLFAVEGKGPLAGLSFSIKEGDGANNQQYSDEVDPADGAESVLTYKDEPAAIMPPNGRSDHTRGVNSSGSAALLVKTATFKVAYFAFGFEAISTAKDRAAVMGKVIEQLRPTLRERVAGAAAQGADARSAQRWAGLTQSLVRTGADRRLVSRSGIRDLLRAVRGTR